MSRITYDQNYHIIPNDIDMDLDFFKQLLLQRQNDLLAVGDSNQQAAATVELDQTRVGRLSRMDSLQMQAMAVESERRRQLELRRIVQALRRIDSEDDGYCLDCDELINEKRLSFDPATLYCIDCASKREQL